MKCKKMITVLLTLGITIPQGLVTRADSSVKNVILFVTDGMSQTHLDYVNWYNKGKKLDFQSSEYKGGKVKTHSASDDITDSAAGGSAYSTGHKINNDAIAISPNSNHKPLPTLIEGARLEGKATGIVFTSDLTDATPATFGAHTYTRENKEIIAEQLVHSGVDVLLGGGRKLIGDKEAGDDGNSRKDKEDLAKLLPDLGYKYIRTKPELMDVSADKVFGLFKRKSLDADMDLKTNKNTDKRPTLKEMTEKAIELLEKKNSGFFLMVEASQIDWFAHSNDPVGIYSEIMGFEEAWKAAVSFAKSRTDTIVLSTSDHATGVMKTKNIPNIESVQSIIKNIDRTTYNLDETEHKDDIADHLAKHYGLLDLKSSDLEKIKESIGSEEEDAFSSTVGHLLASKFGITFQSHDHTAENVNLFVYTPNKVDKPPLSKGLIQNNELGKYIQDKLGVDLDKYKDIYITKKDIEKKGAKLEIKGDNLNPVIKITTKSKKIIELPVDKNSAIIDGNDKKKIALKVVTVIVGKDEVKKRKSGIPWISSEILDELN